MYRRRSFTEREKLKMEFYPKVCEKLYQVEQREGERNGRMERKIELFSETIEKSGVNETGSIPAN